MKINFPPDFREFVGLLEKNEVAYMIVDGYADLIRNKKASNRSKDKGDIENLEQ